MLLARLEYAVRHGDAGTMDSSVRIATPESVMFSHLAPFTLGKASPARRHERECECTAGKHSSAYMGPDC
jgi:hypothetical protein